MLLIFKVIPIAIVAVLSLSAKPLSSDYIYIVYQLNLLQLLLNTIVGNFLYGKL